MVRARDTKGRQGTACTVIYCQAHNGPNEWHQVASMRNSCEVVHTKKESILFFSASINGMQIMHGPDRRCWTVTRLLDPIPLWPRPFGVFGGHGATRCPPRWAGMVGSDQQGAQLTRQAGKVDTISPPHEGCPWRQKGRLGPRFGPATGAFHPWPWAPVAPPPMGPPESVGGSPIRSWPMAQHAPVPP